MMKKIQHFLIIPTFVLLFSCGNAQFVGTWDQETAVWDGGAPLPFLPLEIKLNSDYSYHLNGTYTGTSGTTNGTYNLVGDSIFFGADSLERFKVVSVNSTHLIVKRSFIVTSSYKSWFGVTITYIKQ